MTKKTSEIEKWEKGQILAILLPAAALIIIAGIVVFLGAATHKNQNTESENLNTQSENVNILAQENDNLNIQAQNLNTQTSKNLNINLQNTNTRNQDNQNINSQNGNLNLSNQNLNNSNQNLNISNQNLNNSLQNRNTSSQNINSSSQNVNASPEGQKKITFISDKYIFSTADLTFQGEGFFVEFSNKNKIFIYNDNFNRSPHDIENLRRKIEAVQQGVGELTYGVTTPREVYLATKTSLGMEDRLLNSSQYQNLAQAVIQSGGLMTIDMVPMDSVKIDESKIKVNSSEISSVGPMAVTTGGSVYVFPVYLKNGSQLNIGDATWNPDVLDKLNAIAKEIKDNLNTQFTIMADNISFQDKIYVVVLDTNAGQTWTGWVANIGYVTIEK